MIKNQKTKLTTNKSKINNIDMLLNQINIPVALIDSAGDLKFYNHYFYALYDNQNTAQQPQNYFDFLKKAGAPIPFKASLFGTKAHLSPVLLEQQLNPNKKVIYQWRAHPLSNDLYLIIGEDVTTIMNQQKRNRLLNDSIIDLIPNHYILWKDKNSTYLGCNKALSDSLGLSSPKDIIGKTDYDLPTTKEQNEAFIADDQEVMRTKTPKLNIEETQTLPDKTTRVLMTSKTPLFDEHNQVCGVLAIYSDITERKKIETELKLAKERAEVASIAKTAFLENMRHDIRTPLTGIVGFSELMKSEAENAKFIEYTDNLIASSHALLELMDEVMEAIRIGAGETPLHQCKFSLQKTLQHVVNLNKAKANSKGVQFDFKYDQSIPKYIIGDHVRIHRIALELVANALNFTNDGTVTLKAELAKAINQQLIIKISVIDTGIGIPKEKQNIIFQQFNRLNPSYQGRYKGTGLGLSIIKQFVDEIDAEIYVDSTPEKGSTFDCIIPVKKPLLDDDEHVDKQFDEPNLNQNIKKPSRLHTLNLNESQQKDHHVLIVEDSLVAQTVAKAMLSQCGCTISIAETGQQAQMMWQNNQFDLIFMDIGLPDMDGYEVTHYIRLNEASWNKSHTPIVALTAHIGAESKKKCIEAGMNAILSKPLSKEDCIQTLDTFIPSRTTKMTEEQLKYAKELPDDEDQLFKLDHLPVLDIETGIETTGSHEMLQQMVELMVDHTLEDDLRLLTQAYQNDDWGQLQNIAHKIKGGVVYVGALKLQLACQYLERYYKAGQKKHLKKLYEQIIQVSKETISEFNNYLKLHKDS